MSRRVVVTGLGVVAPNGVGIQGFEDALKSMKSGISWHEELRKLNFTCQIAGQPVIPNEILGQYFSPLELKGLNSSGIIYGVISGVDAWKDAGLELSSKGEPAWDSGIIFGTGILGVDKFREAIHSIEEGKVRRLGSTSVVQTMASGVSTYLNSKIGCGNIVTTNSSACTTGTEAVVLAYERICAGKADKILAGSCGESGPYVWGGFDAMRILPHQFNDAPPNGSRPMSRSAAGFVPGSGAGALVLEDLGSALDRGAPIYAEVLGGSINSGGQRSGGSMTAPNPEGVQRCIRQAIESAGIHPRDITLINGHLTATTMDFLEIQNWTTALDRRGSAFPYINSLKGMTGHCLSAAGSIECVASVLQIKKDFIFGNLNSEDLHPDIEQEIGGDKVLLQTVNQEVPVVAKASFGFGDVNAVVIFKKYATT